MDKFVQYTETDNCTGEFGEPGLVMDYYDGNTVTALWNYAQHYAMSDNNYDTQFGPSTPGALNVISGQTGGGYAVNPATGAKTTDASAVSALNGSGLGTIYGDLDPAYDDCSDSSHTSASPLGVETGKNKAAEYQDAHPGYSDPLDEQDFIVSTVNSIEESKYWRSTAIVITYDDSDGWYDHVNGPRPNGSHDSTTDQAVCTSVPARLGSYQDRCGYGPRLPLVVISPYTRANYVSHNVTDQSSVVSFIENNWLHGERIGGGSYDAIAGNLAGRGGVLDFSTRPNFKPLILNPATGAVVSKQ